MKRIKKIKLTPSHRVRKKRVSRFTPAIRAAMCKEYATGSTAKELAEAFNCSPMTAYMILHEGKAKMRRGKESEFDAENCKEIATEYAKGIPARALAQVWECSAPTIIRIVKDEGGKVRPRGRVLGVKQEPKAKPKVKVKTQKLPSNKALKKAARGAKAITGKAIKTKVTYKAKAKRKKPARKA